MPAVSGSPTQNSTSCDTPAQLAGTPSLAFKDGDLGFVKSLKPNGTFQLDRESVAVPNNVTVIDTFEHLGRWLVFPPAGGGGGGGTFTVEDQPVTPAGQVNFTLGAVPIGNVVQMFVNGTLYVLGTDYTVAGTAVTWLDVPFALAVNDHVIFTYTV